MSTCASAAAARHLDSPSHLPPSPVPRSCTLVNSPLATNVTGQMKDILTTALGMVIFHGARLCIVCLCLSFFSVACCIAACLPCLLRAVP